MRKYFYLFILLFIGLKLNAQDCVNTTSYLTALNDTIRNIFIDSTSNKYFKCWNYGSASKSEDNALKMNFQLDGLLPKDFFNFAYTTADFTKMVYNLSMDPLPVASAATNYSITQASAFQYEPYLQVDSNIVDTVNNYHFIEHDSTGAVFGFLNLFFRIKNIYFEKSIWKIQN